MYCNKLNVDIEEKGRRQTTPTWRNGGTNYDSWGYIVSKARAEIRSAGDFPSSQEGLEVRRVVNEYSMDMGIWKETGRLPGRYKDFPHKKLPNESIFDKPIDDRDIKIKKTVRFKSNPVSRIKYYIPEGTYK
ncbi:MAG TPA: hypothetical protein VGF75_02785 [Candidatus Saccharimonadales bacterium]